MKAIVLTGAGGPEQLAVADLPTPAIERDDQVLVRLRAASINPIDTKIRQAPERFPVAAERPVLGCDGAGVVEAVGAAVEGFAPGDEVWFCQCGFNGRQGTYAEYALVDACFLAPKPKSLSFEQAAALPLVAITAWESLHDRAGLEAGERVLVHGGAGGVGHVAVQLAAAAGAKVAVTVSTPEKARFVEALGAELAILYRERDFVEATLEWSGGEGADLVLDTVGGEVMEKSFAAVAVYGDLVTILGAPAGLDLGVARKRNIRFTQELMLTPIMMELDSAKAHQGEILRHCAELCDQGRLRAEVAAALPLERAAEAHRLLEQEHPAGKVVLTIDG